MTADNASSHPNLAIFSGEMSGDLVGGALAGALKQLAPDLALWGLGSRHMAEHGVELLHDSAAWSAIGVMEALKVYPELRFKVLSHVLRAIEERAPKAVVLIDFGAFNVRIAAKCKQRGIPVLYYFPPGSWRKKGRSGAGLVPITDRIATPFPWSAERLAAVGANVEFVGHPLLELVRPSMTRQAFADRYGLSLARPIVGLLPGSRKFEVEHNTPAMLGAADIIRREVPGAQFVFGLASNAARGIVEQCLEREEARLRARESGAQPEERPQGKGRDPKQRVLVTPEGVRISAESIKHDADRTVAKRAQDSRVLPPVVLAERMTYDVMAHADALIICSGTATLEAAILGTPMAILYRGSRLMELEAKVRRVRPEHIGMPNIIAERRIVPEFIQHDATPEALAEFVLKMLRDPQERAHVRAELESVRDTLGTPGASVRTAAMVADLAGLAPRRNVE